MNQGTTITETTMLDDSSSGRASLCDSSSAATTSLHSASSTPNIISDGMVLVYNYKGRDFEKFSSELMCEQICSRLCRSLRIAPTTQLLFGIRLNEAENRWILPGERLECCNRYAFRLRFKVPEMYKQLKLLDERSHEYLYYQMRSDMLKEHIAEIRYPMKKDNVMGLGVVDMVVDTMEHNVQPECVERKYKNYLPRKLLRAHGPFVKSRICATFRELHATRLDLGQLKYHYIHEIYNLAPKYLLEQFKAVVEHLPDEPIATVGVAPTHSTCTSSSSTSTLITTSNSTLATTATIANGHSPDVGSISVNGSSNGGSSSGGAITGLLNLMHLNHNHSGSSRSSCETDVTRTTTTSRATTNTQSTNTFTSIRGQQRRVPGMAVYLKLSMHDSAEPGLKIATVTTEDKLKWLLLAKIEDIYALYLENDGWMRLEINGFPKGYRLHFEEMYELKSFISYLGGYMRLTKNWMLDLCLSYITPSLKELKELRCHGPIGGNYSVAKIHQKRDECGSYIIRQCEKEYDVYYIDINTRGCTTQRDRCRTETYQIRRDENKWLLNYNGETQSYKTLVDLAQAIPCESEKKFRIPPSDYDKPPLLVICLAKNMQTKRTDTELSEAELHRKRTQIFDPKTDLQYYINSFKLCDGGKMCTYRADWIQQGSFKDVPVTLKVLSLNADFKEFMKLADTWSLTASPQFIKLYGLTLSTPYTMIMEYSQYGPLNEFLFGQRNNIKMLCLLDVIHGLVRGMHYLEKKEVIHSYIRCSNMYVTKYDPHNNILEAKINDPGLPRPYREDELPWIPFEYYGKMQEAKTDPATQLWAFATTIWEIFARGCPLGRMSAQQLIYNYNIHGGILPPNESLCPKEMYGIMMDGWSRDEPDKRFDHQKIFATLNVVLNVVQNNMMKNYVEVCPDTSSTCDEPIDFDNINGHAHNHEHDHNGVTTNLTFSNNSTMPLLTGGNCDGSSTGADAAFMAGFNTNGFGAGAPSAFAVSTQQKQQQQRSINHQQQQQQQQQEWLFPSKYCDDTPSVLQINDGKVIYKEKNKIGQGHYGTVYRGEIRYNDPNRPPEQVAIKKLKSNQMKKLTDDFAREINIMQPLDHPNVVKFKYWIDEPIAIIMEYFEYGCFMVYLTSRKPNLTNEKLLRFALDIAEGMNYLGSKDVIHRDLAARNILVDRDCVKISDFGLAQIADSDGYYFARSVREIPIKWYSPESIKTSKFSFQSDVWSYGVTLFEMFSRGEIPNLVPGRDLTQEEFLNHLDNGERLRQPTLCPDTVYQQIMRPCWQADPKKRPTFKQIIDIIQQESGEII